MKIKDLISPKWKHSNPAVRLKAVKAISCNDIDLLQKILLTETDAGIRHTIIQKISNEELLSKTASNDKDEVVKQAALSKLHKLYADRIPSLSDIDEQLALLDLINDEKLIASVAPKVDNPEFRVNIVTRISDQGLLCAMSESNCGVKAGKAIIEKITDAKYLDRISQKASSKKIRKMAQEKIDLSKLPAQTKQDGKTISDHDSVEIETLCIIVKSHCNSSDITIVDHSIEKAERLLKKTTIETSHPLLIELVSVLAQLKEHRETLNKSETTSSEYLSLINDLKKLADENSITEADKTASKRLISQWETISKNNIDTTVYESLFTAFEKERAAFEDKYSLLVTQQEETNQKFKILQTLYNETEVLVSSDDINTLKNELETIVIKWEKNDTKSEKAAALQQKFNENVRRCKEQLSTLLESKKIKTETEIKSLLDKIRKTSEETGNALFKNVAEVKSTISQWNKMDDIDADADTEFKNLCDTFFEKLDTHKKNKDWEEWANLSLKTELCEKADQVSTAAQNAAELFGFANIIRSTQKEWKEIGPVTRDKSDEIWNRFRLACDTVFTLCLNEKTALLAKVKDAAELQNFNEASPVFLDIQQQWKKMGALPLALEKSLRDEFNQICDSFFEKKRNFMQEKETERNTNLALKLTLCDKAEELSGSAISNGTTDLFKKLQSDWKKIGAVPRNQSDTIWERFSLACNAYFDSLEKSKPENLTIKKELLADAIKVLASAKDGLDVRDACKEIITIQKTWNSTGPVPQEEADLLWKEFRTVCDEIFSIRDGIQETLSKDYEENRLKKETLMSKAQAMATSDDWATAAVELKTIQDNWKSTGPAARKDDQELWARFRRINDEFFNRRRDHFNERDEERNANLCIKEGLCLTLELLAKISIDKADLEYNKDVPLAEQLSKARELRESYVTPGDAKATRVNVMQKVKEIQIDWKKTGPVPSDKDSSLWERYKNAGDLFYSK